MRGLDTRSLPGAARWGGAGSESPRSATQASSAGYFLGPLIFLQELAKPAFSSRFVPSWFIVSAFSLARKSARGCATGLVTASPLATWKSGNRRFFLSSPQQIGGERVFFGNSEPIWGPWSQGQWPGPLLASRSSLAGARPPPSRVYPVYPGARARFLTRKARLNLRLHLLPWRVSSCLPLPGGHPTSPSRALISTRRFQQSDRLQRSVSAP